ncbi:hypothetical protein ADIARSV_1740 [Arcticibacter svalbardensis MN12-7]|uniref:Glycoside hydrolase family 5 domain-containing protein n=1 Tax=Arcticibacter svalbardensis MN12-7 TaxID=1150600 RepID=R9GU83_9SPHI|nr:hypothetical protein [Arcticibacter svalbardensis]EOR95085.1 hypothetical protein ADIARSV_1740 [Arcticibacter svalbardensis MN12-7]
MKKIFLMLTLAYAATAGCKENSMLTDSSNLNNEVKDNNIPNVNAASIYTSNMSYVLGDVKQAFIQNKITTTAQADNLIIGFKTMKVNGIRMPIYPTGANPNVTMYDYFYNKAIAAGFKIFANPAQSSGGKHIACGSLTEDCTTLNVTAKTIALVNAIKAYATSYKCTWINPFNEDGSPGDIWSSSQMNTIYSSLKGKVNGAGLIGPDVWGIPGSISVLNSTAIENSIVIASTHNLGFNHTLWPSFKTLAAVANLPVWDSEVNDNDVYGTGSRLDAALAISVNGLVLYDSWRSISLTNGCVNSAGQVMMDKYLN